MRTSAPYDRQRLRSTGATDSVASATNRASQREPSLRTLQAAWYRGCPRPARGRLELGGGFVGALCVCGGRYRLRAVRDTGGAATRWRHVIWIWVENASYGEIIGNRSVGAVPKPVSGVVRACDQLPGDDAPVASELSGGDLRQRLGGSATTTRPRRIRSRTDAFSASWPRSV